MRMADGGDGGLLPAEVLARRASLPLKVAPVTLEGAAVRLAPLDLARDVEPLHAISNRQPATLGDRAVPAYDADALIWRYMTGGPFASAADLADWLRVQVEAPNGLCLCVFDRPTGQPIGVAAYLNNSAWFRILDHEWPAVQRRLEQLLAPPPR
jgi:hypothetical protein